MEIIKVTINVDEGDHSKGVTLDGKNAIIIYGFLKEKNKLIDAVLIKREDNIVACIIPEIHENHIEIEAFQNEENLINTEYLKPTKYIGVYKIKSKFVFVHPAIRGVNYYLRDNQELWEISRLRIVNTSTTKSAAIHYGLTFAKALEKLNSRGIQKARLYCENIKDFSTQGVVAEMLVNLTKDNNGIVTIEVWQGIRENQHVHYLHGMMGQNQEYFTHFDGALIFFSIEEKEKLFAEDIKLKAGEYNKMFRLDGEIPKIDVFNLANAYMPLDRLIDEYFEIEEL